MSLSSQTEVTPNKNSVEASLPPTKSKRDEGLEPPFHDDKNGII